MVAPRGSAPAASLRIASRSATIRCWCCRAAARSARIRRACTRRSSENGFAPDWVTGVSIGAINAALIAGNPPALRVPRLREFWERVSSGMPLVPPAALDPFRRTLNLVSASTRRHRSACRTSSIRAFRRRLRAGRHASRRLSVYDTAPLRETLEELVQFDIINGKEMRFAVGCRGGDAPATRCTSTITSRETRRDQRPST